MKLKIMRLNLLLNTENGALMKQVSCAQLVSHGVLFTMGGSSMIYHVVSAADVGINAITSFLQKCS